MKEGLLQLLSLQEVDKELQALEDAKEKYPAEIHTRQLQIERAEEICRQQEDELAALAARQRQLERGLEAAKSNLKEHEARFAEVTNNREYDALQMEIDGCKTKIGELETQILQTIESSEALQEEVQEDRNSANDVRAEQQERIDELQGKLANLQQEIDAVAARREACTGGIEDNLLRQYERSRKRRGTRVATVRKGACNGCFRAIPPQQRSNVRRNERVQICESCGAILVWDEESS